MYSLFALLFRASYWRMLLRWATWQEAGSSLRRAHKDRRARKHLRGFLLMLLVPVLCLLYTGWVVGSGALIVVPFVVPLFWWRARRAKQDAVPLHIVAPPTDKPRERTTAETAALAAYFAGMTLQLAVLVDRAGSERFLKEKTLPEGFEVTSRRIHLDLLRSRGLWDRMSAADREAMMAADGHWEWWQINRASHELERVRLLRWLLRIDYFLPVVGQQLQMSYSAGGELVREPAKLDAAKTLASWSDVQAAHNAAREYFYRCMAECIHRGYYTASNEGAAEWADGVVTRLKGKQHEDFVVNGRIVSEADEGTLRLATELSEIRMRFLAWVLQVYRANVAPEDLPAVFEKVEELEGAAQ